jgi:DNA-directed RNA polymerase specialized sigma24 family protein
MNAPLRARDATSPARPRPTPYEQHRDYVLGVLARRCGWLARDEREAVFHDAYALLLEKARDGVLEPGAMHAHQVRAYLTTTAIHKALDEGKRAERRRTEPLGEGPLAEPDAGRGPDELADASMDCARVREIVAELPERRQAIVTRGGSRRAARRSTRS